MRGTVARKVMFGNNGSPDNGRRSGIGAGTGGGDCVAKLRKSKTTGVGTRFHGGHTGERGGG